MNPKYIFSAVAAVSIFMALLLPQIGQSSAPAPAPAAAALAVQPAIETAAPLEALPAAPPPTQTPQTAQDVAPPVFDSLPEGLPTPTPLVSSPYVIPLTAANIPELERFAASLVNGQPDQVVGVYVPGLFALPVVAQPGGDESFVSPQDGVLTQYGTPARFGTLGLLAHNYLSGKSFFQLKPDQQMAVVYGDGRIAYFRVTAVQGYQAISPHDVRSDFIDLSDPQAALLTYSQVFDRIYANAGQLVFQTCIEANGELSWGRLFVIAQPVEQPEFAN